MSTRASPPEGPRQNKEVEPVGFTNDYSKQDVDRFDRLFPSCVQTLLELLATAPIERKNLTEFQCFQSNLQRDFRGFSEAQKSGRYSLDNADSGVVLSGDDITCCCLSRGD